MKVFGKTLGEYVKFQRPVLIVILAVGLLRLFTSLGGVSMGTARFFSMTVVVLLGVIYYGISVPKTGFGTYRHLLPLVFIQAALSNAIVILGILIAIATGHDNIFTAPEFSPGMPGTGAFHIFGHVAFGTCIGSLIGWALSSLVMWITKKLTKRSPATAT